MAARIVTQGLSRIGAQASQTSTIYSSTRHIQTMAVDDATEAFQAADTKLDDGTGYTQEFDAAFDSTPTVASGVVTHIMTIPSGSGNFTIKRISLHDNAAGSVSGTSTTLVGGIDGQSITKSSDFALAITVTITYATA